MNMVKVEEINSRIKAGEFNVEGMFPLDEDESFYPCYPGHCIKISLSVSPYFGYPGFFQLVMSADGMDDYSLIYRKSFIEPEYVQSYWETTKKYIYDRIPSIVSQDWLFEHGFLWE